MTLRIGSCLCRRVRFNITGDPFHHVLCHCSNCKKISGSAFMANVFFKEQNVTITQGQDTIKRYEDSDTTSGRSIGRSFCSNCGSTLFIHPSEEVPGNDFVIVASGCVDGETDWVPKKEAVTEAKFPWLRGVQLAQPKNKKEEDQNKL